MDHLEQPVRIWTDYERFNRTHFWSKTANEWWQKVDHGGQGSTHCLVRALALVHGSLMYITQSVHNDSKPIVRIWVFGHVYPRKLFL